MSFSPDLRVPWWASTVLAALVPDQGRQGRPRGIAVDDVPALSGQAVSARPLPSGLFRRDLCPPRELGLGTILEFKTCTFYVRLPGAVGRVPHAWLRLAA